MPRPSLNIAFFGSSLVSSYWNGAANYYRGIVKALAERGHFEIHARAGILSGASR